jgi:hypothetical protein
MHFCRGIWSRAHRSSTVWCICQYYCLKHVTSQTFIIQPTLATLWDRSFHREVPSFVIQSSNSEQWVPQGLISDTETLYFNWSGEKPGISICYDVNHPILCTPGLHNYWVGRTDKGRIALENATPKISSLSSQILWFQMFFTYKEKNRISISGLISQPNDCNS